MFVSCDVTVVLILSSHAVFDKVYTSASDVWSYGVFCWEVFTLGESPYAELDPESAIKAIMLGHRLSRPALCSEQMFVVLYMLLLIQFTPPSYELMMMCWSIDPLNRPTFRACLRHLSSLDDEEIAL